jgi:hypothetical protein
MCVSFPGHTLCDLTVPGTSLTHIVWDTAVCRQHPFAAPWTSCCAATPPSHPHAPCLVHPVPLSAPRLRPGCGLTREVGGRPPAAEREEARRKAAEAAAASGGPSGPTSASAGVSWRMKAVARAQQLAKEQGRGLNEVRACVCLYAEGMWPKLGPKHVKCTCMQYGPDQCSFCGGLCMHCPLTCVGESEFVVLRPTPTPYPAGVVGALGLGRRDCKGPH